MQKKSAVKVHEQLRATLLKLISQGKNEEAWEKIHLRLRFFPHDAWFLAEAAKLARRNNQYDIALNYYHRALSLRKNDAGLLNELGLTYYGMDNFAEAERAWLAALKIVPHYAACHNNYAIILHKMHRFEEAIHHYQLTLNEQPDHDNARYGLSTVFAHLGRLDEAEAHLRIVTNKCPDDERMKTTLGMVLLQQGKAAEGWQCYQSRYAPGNTEKFFAFPDIRQPYWKGENLHGKTILIKTEQGSGDEIQFCRFIASLKTLKGASRVIMVGRDPLKSLLNRLPGLDVYWVSGDQDPLPAFDCWCLLLDLPQHFLCSDNPFAGPVPYIVSAAGDVEKWKLSRDKFKIGIVWKGSSAHFNDKQRSLPHLSILAPLLTLEDIEWVSLQKGEGESEPAEWPNIFNTAEQLHDFSATASLISKLDLVIGVDTSVIHLAGAMGKPCWVILPATARDWRWLQGKNETPWYPEMRLFPRERGEEWQVIERVRQALVALRATDH